MIKVQSIMQLVKDKAKNQMTSLFYSVQKRLHKKSEDPVVNLQCLQSVYMASFTQTRVNFLCHLNNSRALFESNPCDPLTCSDNVDYCYTLMERFLHANPGLESRFNKYFHFDDYNGAQLMEIFQAMCRKNGYTLDPAGEACARAQFQALYDQRDENFGNARDVRNRFERAVARQADRLAALEAPGKEELMALTEADLKEEA